MVINDYNLLHSKQKQSKNKIRTKQTKQKQWQKNHCEFKAKTVRNCHEINENLKPERWVNK